tara:strand:- start:17 stop:235 length:219 start_codon:yes stop_codon:yes gene_type:complete
MSSPNIHNPLPPHMQRRVDMIDNKLTRIEKNILKTEKQIKLLLILTTILAAGAMGAMLGIFIELFTGWANWN